MRASRSPSLDRQPTTHKINHSFTVVFNLTRTLKHVNVHRFEETIGGRAYSIEVTPVGDRWRAQLRRIAGMPTAMMPFYGQTPDGAAHLLAQWLEIAHRRASQATPAAATVSTL